MPFSKAVIDKVRALTSATIVCGGPAFSHLLGVVYRQGGEVILNGGRCASAFTSPPRLDDLDMHKYAQAGFGIGVLTKLDGFYYPASGSRAQMDQNAWRVIRPIDEVVQDVYPRWNLV